MGELDGIDPALHPAYRLCRALNAEHGKTYFLATRLLPVARRAGVHALYGFARMVDDVVDVAAADDDDGPIGSRLDALEDRLRAALGGGPTGHSESDLVLAALADATARYDIPHEYFYAFLHSMRMDVPGSPVFRSRYRTMPELAEYMYGSAAVIGLQMLPILGTTCAIDEAVGPASALGEAFQLTNFIRDMGEDLGRDRIYLPTDELAAFGVDEELLRNCRATGRVDPRLRRALAHLIAHTRAVYRTAEPGIDLLDPAVRSAMRTASVLYADILREVEDSDYRVLERRARVSRRRRVAVAAPRLATAGWSSLRARRHPASRPPLPVTD
ncbi:phytoene/squalene synthase family protein [Rhodococcus sp. SGAir0479]|uniref:phytoene/squalene synthase family protein n=1 Tax=Rhodococcus sp. SGAir0479 TaxID=2567884 RepID=UPI0010CD2EF5|nr:phytoene/squalene synthase family protein [Rhodococcus sp. SGAir0479]QCQ90191.1 phytoene/squalene synthase family protein [Rhodococcus sp. SGAir0479]